MRRLSGYLFRVALLSALAAIVVILTATWIGDWVMFRLFLDGLPPELRAEFLSDIDEMSQPLANALNTYYTGWMPQLLLPATVVLGLAVGGVIGIMHSRRLLNPLDRLAEAAGRMALGETSVRVPAPPGGIDEINALSRSFNAMAEAVERSERNLRESNAAIAHELRTPLTILVGRINGMLDEVFPTDPEGLRLLLVQTSQLQHIIEDLNLLTMAEAGRFRVNAEPSDLSRIVAAMLAPGGGIARGAAQGIAGTEGDVEYALRPAPANADAARVRQVLTALLENARRHAGGRLRVETGVRDGRAFLSVADRGPGLTAEQAARMFDRFWRADASRSKNTGGSGLGLSVARSIAEAHGGSLRYADRPGGGAVLTLDMPSDG